MPQLSDHLLVNILTLTKLVSINVKLAPLNYSAAKLNSIPGAGGHLFTHLLPMMQWNLLKIVR
jgi:hypothetical protein